MHHDELLLISHHLCPYVQRSLITLAEKNIAHQRRYVDLSNKPQWFLQLSPLGKVPVLQVDGKSTVFESAVICEFLDEVTPGSLHPSEPLGKARHRAWIEFGSQLLGDIARLYNAGTEATFNDGVEVIHGKLKRLEPEVQGPWFNGERFSLVDAAYGPIFRYFDTLDSYLPFNPFEGSPSVQAWRGELARRPSVQNAVADDYPIQLKDFLLRRASHLSTRIAGAEQVRAC
ncbi:MAG: glutathione S-transferase family protein [Marinobacter sp.]|uniref:glutathione S-transferase family protein n=1 Tax=Marinobacter sp. TaxID=50741 RepID=UPI00299D6366|nr:glutathione S-transferase family protein [Marinobacter sp.]MDX1755733.1 glutathione S-transferase family protein [Marinobacter sp.]